MTGPMPTFKLSWRTRVLLRWVNLKRALDIGAEPRPLMGLPDPHPGRTMGRSMAPPAALDGESA